MCIRDSSSREAENLRTFVYYWRYLFREDLETVLKLMRLGRYCWVLWNDNIGKISNTVKAHANEYEAFTKQGVMTTCDDLKCIADFTKIPFDPVSYTHLARLPADSRSDDGRGHLHPHVRPPAAA